MEERPKTTSCFFHGGGCHHHRRRWLLLFLFEAWTSDGHRLRHRFAHCFSDLDDFEEEGSPVIQPTTTTSVRLVIL
jgi:hypothetical protein